MEEQKMVYTPEPSQTPEVKPVEIKKTPILMIILVLLLVLSIGASIFLGYQNMQLTKQIVSLKTVASPIPTASSTFVSPDTSDPTINWKTYTNTDFSFKYPADTTLTVNKDSSVSITKWGPTQKAQTEFFDGINLMFISRTLNNQPLEQLVDQEINQSAQNGSIKIEKTPIAVNNYQGFTYTSEGLGTQKYIFIQSPLSQTKFIEITDSSVDPSNQGFEQTIDQIISTLKFTQ